MRAVVQRVSEAAVRVDGEVVGAIQRGLLVFLGAAVDDTPADVATMAEKIAGLRVFADNDGKMSRSVQDLDGGVLVVSQFTLFGDVRRGRRPSFDGAAPPELAQELYELAIAHLRAKGLPVASGRFRASMLVSSINDGPVTILIDTKKLF